MALPPMREQGEPAEATADIENHLSENGLAVHKIAGELAPTVQVFVGLGALL